jgi:hypothetical protein
MPRIKDSEPYRGPWVHGEGLHVAGGGQLPAPFCSAGDWFWPEPEATLVAGAGLLSGVDLPPERSP